MGRGSALSLFHVSFFLFLSQSVGRVLNLHSFEACELLSFYMLWLSFFNFIVTFVRLVLIHYSLGGKKGAGKKIGGGSAPLPFSCFSFFFLFIGFFLFNFIVIFVRLVLQPWRKNRGWEEKGRLICTLIFFFLFVLFFVVASFF